MYIFKQRFIKKPIQLSLLLGLIISFGAYAVPSTEHTENYLIIATGTGEVFNSNGGEFGANQEVVASASKHVSEEHYKYDGGGIDLSGDFTPNGDEGVDKDKNRWVDYDGSKQGEVVGKSDYLPGAKNLNEVPDYSGNIAITDESGKFVSENTDYFASIGINCVDASTCFASDDGDNGWKQSAGSSFSNLSDSNGVFGFDPSDVVTEINEWRNYIDNVLVSDVTWTMKSIEEQSYKSGTGPYVTDLDAIDTNNDGFAVIDIAGGSDDFLVNNTDWILKTLADEDGNTTKAVFRMDRGTNFNFTNSSIMMGCEEYEEDDKGIPGLCEDEDIDELGAIFYVSDKYDAKGNEVFNLSNVILGGIGLWDLDTDNNTIIDTDNVQGCTQYISSKVNSSSTSRLNRCANTIARTPPTTTEVPEPPMAILLMLAGLGGLAYRKAHKS